MSFEPFNFDEQLRNAIEQANFTRASKIQQLVIPEILEGHDILVSAHSGSGKSASFVLPLIQKLLETPRAKQTEQEEDIQQGARILVITPTRELANQVSACIRRFTKSMDLRYGILVGGAPYPPQVRMLKKPVDFLVATPGRLLDHMHNERVNFNDIDYLVVDELNRILDMDLDESLYEILEALPDRQRQTLIFTGNLDHPRIEEVSNRLQKDPVRFELARNKQHYRDLQQSMYIADNIGHKQQLVNALLSQSTAQDVLIYSHQRENLASLSLFLQQQAYQPQDEAGFELNREQQNLFLCVDEEKLKKKITSAPDIKIIHLDLPDDILVFLQRLEPAIDHQSQREMCILVGQDDWPLLHQIERYIGKTLGRKKIEGLEPQSSEPSVGSKSSNGRNKNNNQTKNRNPYSGRRQNNNTNNKTRKQKPSENKMAKAKRGSTTRKRRAPNQALDGNNFNIDSHLDERELQWKQYISNISSGAGNSKSANRKYKKRQGGQSGGFDLNNSPMAISAKKVRDMNQQDEWMGNEEKKPQVQIKVKGQGKKPGGLLQDKAQDTDSSNERIDGKLSINK